MPIRSAVAATVIGGVVALSGLSLAVHAQVPKQVQAPTRAEITQAVAAFESQCLTKLPTLPKVAAGFAIHGYTEKTDDPNIFAKPGGGFAGLGLADVVADDADKPDKSDKAEKKADKSGKPPHAGCVVYVKGLETAPVIKAVEAVSGRRFKKSKKLNDAKDFYLGVMDYAPRNGFIIIVAAKLDGKFAGHTLVMVQPVTTPADKQPDKLADYNGPLEHKGPGGIVEVPVKPEAKKALGAVIPDAPIERAKLLRDLYAHLATATDEQAAAPHVEAIERIWLSPGSDTVLALMERAMAAAAHQRPDLALNLLTSVVTMAPDYAEGFNRRADIFYAVGDRERALGDLRRVLALDPNHFKAIESFAQIMKDFGDKKAAYTAYQKLISIHPFWPSAQSAHDELKRELEGQGL
jgi:tetratricopeptide (TPR) repeat protein